MANQTDLEQEPTIQEFHTSTNEQDEKLDRVAEEAAEKSSKTEKRFDRDHGIFTK